MKACILVLVILACILKINCFYQSKEFNFLPERFQSLNLADDESESDFYKKTLAALQDAAASEDNNDSAYDLYDSNDVDSGLNNYYDDPINADQRDEESESHSSLGSGYQYASQYVSGGAGEGKQHLQPDGHLDNKEEVKSDEDLPAYCHPPNPCPVGYKGEDCDKRPYQQYTAEYSKDYQDQQNCMCDDDHNECHKTINYRSKLGNKFSPVVAKKSPRIKRNARFNPRSKRAINF
jgi:hypothetical protein